MLKYADSERSQRLHSLSYRLNSADLTCPIILSSDGSIMDGSHRLVAASIKELKMLPTVRFDVDPAPDYIEPMTS